MEGAKSKASAGNKDFFLKMRSNQDGQKKVPPPVASKPKAPAVAPKPGAAAEANKEIRAKTAEELEQEEVRRKEKEAYQRQKEQLEREEAAAKLAAEEKANLRKQREEREQKEREEREQKEREEREREGQKQKQEQKEEETNLQEETKEQQAPEGNVTLQEEQQKASSSQDTQNRIAASVEASKPKTFRCRALLNYDAKNENELTFKKDDVIFVISPDLSAKALNGVLKGNSGTFPGHFVENTEDGKRCGDPSLHFKMGVKCRALGNYLAKGSNELSFCQGDMIFVSVLNNDKMVQGVFQGKVGLLPRKLVVDAAEAGELSVQVESPVARCIAIRPHFSNREGWLDFDRGDVVMVPKKTISKVWKGVFKGNVGKLRSEFVMDAAEHTQEEIDAAIHEFSKSKPTTVQGPQDQQVRNQPKTTNDPFSTPADPFMADPFSTPVDPFFPTPDPSDPFSPKTGTNAKVTDPFAPQVHVSPDPFTPASATVDPFTPAGIVATQAFSTLTRDPFSPSTQTPLQTNTAPMAKGASLPQFDVSAFENIQAAPPAHIHMRQAASALGRPKDSQSQVSIFGIHKFI